MDLGCDIEFYKSSFHKQQKENNDIESTIIFKLEELTPLGYNHTRII